MCIESEGTIGSFFFLIIQGKILQNYMYHLTNILEMQVYLLQVIK